MRREILIVAAVTGALFLASCKRASSESTGSSGAKESAKKSITVGFSQIGAESAWRTAETASVRYEAAKRGVNLKFSDAQQKQENQIKALGTFIAQRVDAIILAPMVEDGWEPILKQARNMRPEPEQKFSKFFPLLVVERSAVCMITSGQHP